jgi:hypothetical protein
MILIITAGGVTVRDAGPPGALWGFGAAIANAAITTTAIVRLSRHTFWANQKTVSYGD